MTTPAKYVPNDYADPSPLVILFSDISWDGLHQRPQHLALALARRWPVLWVEPAVLSRMPRFTPLVVEPNIFRMSLPGIPYNARSPFIRVIAKIASRIPLVRTSVAGWQRRILGQALRFLGRNDASKVILLQNFHVIDLIDGLQPAMVLYDYIDNVFGFTTVPSHVRELWARTLERADIVTVTSPMLARQVRSDVGSESVLIGNGVEYALFAESGSLERPSDLPSGKPIVCYVGAVYPWLDYELMQFVCRELQHVNVVFIGPVHPSVAENVNKLRRLPNVEFLGVRPYHRIPAYLRHIDVGIIPFQRNDLTMGVNPVKLYEYSAAGKQTVATMFSDDLEEFRSVISLANSPQVFVSLVVDALSRARDPKVVAMLRAFAHQHDWRQKTGQLIALIEEFLSSHMFLGKDVHGKK